MLDKVDRLQGGLGSRDRAKLDEYLQSVREIERRIQNAESQGRELPVVESPAGIPVSYDEHARLMFDMQALAFQTDTTRVITFQIGREQSGATYPQIGVSDSHHPISHHGGDKNKIESLAKINAYHVSLFAYFLERLRRCRTATPARCSTTSSPFTAAPSARATRTTSATCRSCSRAAAAAHRERPPRHVSGRDPAPDQPAADAAEHPGRARGLVRRQHRRTAHRAVRAGAVDRRVAGESRIALAPPAGDRGTPRRRQGRLLAGLPRTGGLEHLTRVSAQTVTGGVRRHPRMNPTSSPQHLPERLPEPGELVQVRSRHWLVEEVSLPPVPGQSARVRLACADDDAQGRTIEVFWNCEIDRRILEQEGWAGLAARGFDAPRQFAAFLHTLRWNSVTATDPNLFQSPFRAGITIDAYQMEPLRKALRLPRVNLFIADDTGLGKTIEAGLIARELLLRKKAKTIVAAAPPSVLEQWKAEMEERFGLLFEILDRAYLARMRRERGFGVNPWRTHSRFLVSHNLLIDPTYADPLREWLGSTRPGSLLILDEAHHAAPSSGGRYGIETKFTRAVRDLAGRFEHRLFLSATPHNGHSTSFSTLLELLDPSRFTRGVKVGRKALDDVMVRRLKEDIREAQGGFPRRVVVPIRIDGLPDDAPELALSRLLDEYRDTRDQRHASGSGAARAAAGLLVVGLQQRLLSSVEAFARSLAVHRRTVERQQAGARAVRPDTGGRSHPRPAVSSSRRSPGPTTNARSGRPTSSKRTRCGRSRQSRRQPRQWSRSGRRPRRFGAGSRRFSTECRRSRRERAGGRTPRRADSSTGFANTAARISRRSARRSPTARHRRRGTTGAF